MPHDFVQRTIKRIASRTLRKRKSINPDIYEHDSPELDKKPPGYQPMLCAYDFSTQDEEELPFYQGDIILVKDKTSKWTQAIDCRTWREGKAMMSFLSDGVGESVAFDAFQVADRIQTETQLLVPVIDPGTFILRPNLDKRRLVLSVLMEENGNRKVGHIPIAYDETCKKFYIWPQNKFRNLNHLITYYSEGNNPEIPLGRPYPKQSEDVKEFSEYMLSRQSIEMIRVLGHGSFGEVYLATYRGAEVAVKMALPCVGRKELIEEAKTMYRFDSPRLVRFLGICCDPPWEPLMIITEYMPNGSLYTYLVRNPRLPYVDRLRILSQVAEGMAYLEDVPAVHNDLRSPNVLVDSDYSVKVADFGLSKIVDKKARNTTGLYPARWTAPEATDFEYVYSIKADVWSFGVLMYEVFTSGRLPYADINKEDAVIQAVKEGYRLPNPRDEGGVCNDDEIYPKMLGCWDAKPENRPSFKDLCSFFELKLQGQKLSTQP